jgi:hypothetical protein
MLKRILRCRQLLLVAALFVVQVSAVSAVAATACPPHTPGDLQLELIRAIDNLTSPVAVKCKASPARPGYPNNGWDAWIDPTFNSWGVGGSLNLPVVTAAVGLYRTPYDVMRKSPADYQMTWVNWWVVYLSAQTGEVVPAGYLQAPANRSRLFSYKGTEQFSNIYDTAVVTSIVAVRYWAFLNGHNLLIKLTQKYLRANWAIYAMAAGPTPAWYFDLGPRIFPDGTTAPIRTALCFPTAKGHPNGSEFDQCSPRRRTGGYQYNGRFIALAGARSKMGGHWNSDAKGPLFDRAIEWVPAPLQTFENNLQQGPLMDKLQAKWSNPQSFAVQPPANENLYGLNRVTDIPKIKALITPANNSDVTNAISYLMPWLTFVRTSTTHRILGWPGWRVSLMEANTNGNGPNMYAIAYRNEATDPTVTATFLNPWTDASSGGADGWARLEAPDATGRPRIHASNKNSDPDPRKQPPGQPVKEAVMWLPNAQPLFHVVLSPGNAPYLDTTPPAGWPPIPKLSPPSSYTGPDDRTAWVFNEIPAGGVSGGVAEDWNWIEGDPVPTSEAAFVHQSSLASGMHQHYFYNSTDKLTVNAGDKLYAWAYLDPVNPPTSVMLQWFESSTGFEHRAFWGQNQIGFGVTGTNSRRYMGPLPVTGEWVLLEVPASMVGLEGATISGMAFTLFNGMVTWDEAGKVGQGGPSVNLAVNKSATQSSTLANAPAFRAVDGNTNGNFFSNSVTHTDNNNQAWWQVDLGGVYPIDNINVWNRTDCCPERLSNFYVLVSEDPFTSTDLNATLAQPGVSSFYVSEPAGSPSMVAILRRGRYVRVQLAGTNYLSLAEVEVMGQLPPASVNILWVKPAEFSWGAPNTLTAAGFAQNGTGTVQMIWRDETDSTIWFAADYQPMPFADGSWSNTIPSPNRCHTFRVYANYSGVRSADFVYSGATAGYCTESVTISTIQPQSMAGFGPPGSLVVSGTAANAPSNYGVVMSYRDITAGSGWVQVGFAPAPDGNGNWYNAIENANFSHQYEVRAKYDIRNATPCVYQGTSSFTGCAP